MYTVKCDAPWKTKLVILATAFIASLQIFLFSLRNFDTQLIFNFKLLLWQNLIHKIKSEVISWSSYYVLFVTPTVLEWQVHDIINCSWMPAWNTTSGMEFMCFCMHLFWNSLKKWILKVIFCIQTKLRLTKLLSWQSLKSSYPKYLFFVCLFVCLFAV